MTVIISYIVTEPDGTEREVRFKGRDAWALGELGELILAEPRGCTPIDHPGPRWSGYVHKLRRAGLDIATITEAHGGPYRGHHARYVLRKRARDNGCPPLERHAAKPPGSG